MTKAEEISDRLLEYIWENPGFGEERWVEFRKLIVKSIEQAVAEATKELQEELAISYEKNGVSLRAWLREKESNEKAVAEALSEDRKCVRCPEKYECTFSYCAKCFDKEGLKFISQQKEKDAKIADDLVGYELYLLESCREINLLSNQGWISKTIREQK